MLKRFLVMAIAAATLLLSGCGYNTMQAGDQQIKAAWAEVVNQYQRRSDLIPNLVETVKGFASQEQQVLLGVTNARAKVGVDTGHSRARERSTGFRPISAGAGRAVFGAVPPAGRIRELSAAQVRRQLPRAAGAARGHREPHHGRAQPLHQGGAGVQHRRSCSSRPILPRWSSASRKSRSSRSRTRRK